MILAVWANLLTIFWPVIVWWFWTYSKTTRPITMRLQRTVMRLFWNCILFCSRCCPWCCSWSCCSSCCPLCCIVKTSTPTTTQLNLNIELALTWLSLYTITPHRNSTYTRKNHSGGIKFCRWILPAKLTTTSNNFNPTIFMWVTNHPPRVNPSQSFVNKILLRQLTTIQHNLNHTFFWGEVTNPTKFLFRFEIFWDKKLSTKKICLTINFVWPKTFVWLKDFWLKFFHQIFSQKFFLTKFFFDKKDFLNKIFFWPLIFDKSFFLIIFFYQEFSDPILTQLFFSENIHWPTSHQPKKSMGFDTTEINLVQTYFCPYLGTGR